MKFMKKLLFVFPIVVLLAAGCNSSRQASLQQGIQIPNPAPQQSVSTSTPDQSGTTNWKTYDNSQYGFEIKYPDDFLSKSPQDYGPLYTDFTGDSLNRLVV